MPDKLSDIQYQFFYNFTILSIFNSLIRVVGYSSFGITLYAYISFALLIIYTSIFFILKKKNIDITLLFTIQSTIFFISHYFFVMGTYQTATRPYIWFLIFPIMFLIYYSIKKVIALSFLIFISILLLPKMGELSGIFDYYDSVNTIKTNELTECFFVNLTLTLILSYYITSLYYSYKYIKTKYINSKNTSDLQIQNININNTNKTDKKIKDYLKEIKLKLSFRFVPNKLSEIQNRFLESFIILSIINSIFRIISYYSLEIQSYIFVSFALLAIYIFMYYILKKQTVSNLKLFNILLAIFFISHYFFVMGTYQYTYTRFLWFLIIPIMLLIYYPLKKAFSLSIFVLTLVLLLPKINTLLGISQHYASYSDNFHNNKDLGTYLNRTILLLIALYYFLVLFYFYKAVKISLGEQSDTLTIGNNNIQANKAIENTKNKDTNNIPKEDSNVRDDFRILRLNKTYQTILNHLETNRPYTDPEYTLDQLAIDIQINRTYVSNSLNIIGKISFKDLINQYRINAAKEKFIKDTFRTKNIKQIYYSVGFRHQSTFNRAFKKCEGVTPSEFIINLENRHK